MDSCKQMMVDWEASDIAYENTGWLGQLQICGFKTQCSTYLFKAKVRRWTIPGSAHQSYTQNSLHFKHK